MYTITVLSSSRADYSIYRPFLNLLNQRHDIKLQIIAFGTHSSFDYGHTVDEIEADGFAIEMKLPFVLDGTSPQTIAFSMAKTMEQFSFVWKNVKTDVIVCLGDRYEMFAAVAAAVPFSIPVAHVHGGETTLGAMDNIFRHSLTHMSRLHFVTTEVYRQRVIALTASEKNVFNTGSLSVDNLSSLSLLSIEEFYQKFGVDFTLPTLLTTFHPETVCFEKNHLYAKEVSNALLALSDEFQILITMPNADTMGLVIRNAMKGLEEARNERIFLFENLGTLGYLSAMKHCSMLVGNTSSGFAEAAFFPKWVVNLGNRQDGRLITENIRTVTIKEQLIVETVRKLKNLHLPRLLHPYGNGTAAKEMEKHLLEFLQSKALA